MKLFAVSVCSFHLLVVTLAVKKCRKDEVFMNGKSSSEMKVKSGPGRRKLKEIEKDNMCGYSITYDDTLTCKNMNITYVEYPPTPTTKDTVCSVGKNKTVCLCGWSGCNDIDNMLSSALFHEFVHKTENKTVFAKNDKNIELHSDMGDRLKMVKCLFFSVSQSQLEVEIYDVVRGKMDKWNEFKIKNTNLFPDPEEVNKSKENAIEKRKDPTSLVVSSTISSSSESSNQWIFPVAWTFFALFLISLVVIVVLAVCLCKKKRGNVNKRSKNKKMVADDENKSVQSPIEDKSPLPSPTSEMKTGGSCDESCTARGNYRPLGKHDHVNLNSSGPEVP